MYCYIQEWPNKTATLMTIDGVVLCTFNNTDEAQQVWKTWCQQQKTQMQPSVQSDPQPEIIPCSKTFSRWLGQVLTTCTKAIKQPS